MEELRLASYARLAFWKSIFERDEIWSLMPRPLADDIAEKIAKELDPYFINLRKFSELSRQEAAIQRSHYYYEIGIDPLRGRFSEIDDYDALLKISLAWLSVAEKYIRSRPNYSFINGEKMEDVVGRGRDIIFARNIVRHYCEASASGQDIWVQIGEGHQQGVTCLLQKYLPAETLIMAKTSDIIKAELGDSANSHWVKKFEADTWPKLKQTIQDEHPDIEPRVDRGRDDFQVTINFNKNVSSDTLWTQVERLIRAEGFFLLKRNSNSLQISPDLFHSGSSLNLKL